MGTPRGVRKWAVSAVITVRSTPRIRACAVVGVGDVATADPGDGARVEQVAATSAQPSSCF